jgi:hypothetical protein
MDAMDVTPEHVTSMAHMASMVIPKPAAKQL